MSAEASGYVFRSSPYRGTQFAVHLAIADSVNDQHGNRFWMALDTLSTKARVSRSMVREAILRLRRDGYLRLITESAGRHPSEYEFLFPQVPAVYDTRRREPSDSRKVPPNPPTTDANPPVVDSNPPTTDPNPKRTQGEPKEPSSAAFAATLCGELADRVFENTGRRPTVTKRWVDSARLLLDRDGRVPAEALALVGWCQADEFWRANILSMPKFREKYDQLRLQSMRRRRPRGAIEEFDEMWEEAAADGLVPGEGASEEDGSVLSRALANGAEHRDLDR